MSKTFPPGFEHEIKNLAIDFDGVIHNNDKGYYDGTCYGEPLPGAINAIKFLSKKYTIILFTAKAKPNRPLINGKTGTELVEEWLKRYNIFECITEITSEKPRAFLYIDDNCYRHTDWKNTLTFLKAYEL